MGCLLFYVCDEHICCLALGISAFSTNNIADAVASNMILLPARDKNGSTLSSAKRLSLAAAEAQLNTRDVITDAHTVRTTTAEAAATPVMLQ